VTPTNRSGVGRYASPDEPIRLDARPHGAALVRPLSRALILATVGGVLVWAGATRAWPLAVPGAGLLAFASLGALRAVLAWDRTRLVVTNARLLVIHGIVRRRTASVQLSPGGALEVEQSLAGRLLGYGTLIAGDVEVPFVPDPHGLTH
jgi:uncharacterized membrane protein YdbT with pleckstrin-like domain